MVFSVFVYAYRASRGVSERQPNPKFILSLARADRLQAGMSPLSIISLCMSPLADLVERTV